MKFTKNQLKTIIAEELEEIRLGMHPGESYGFQPRFHNSGKMDSYEPTQTEKEPEAPEALSIEDRVEKLETKIDLILTRLGE